MEKLMRQQNAEILSFDVFVSGKSGREAERDISKGSYRPVIDRASDQAACKVWFEDATKGSSLEERKRLAGLKSRDKKKKYVERLEEDVKFLAA
jgi:hypothetical protein